MDKRGYVILLLLGLVVVSPAIFLGIGALANGFGWLQMAATAAFASPFAGVGLVAWGLSGLVRRTPDA